MSEKQTPEQIQADIEAQRHQLGETVDQLSEKLDVKSQARRRAADVKDRVTTDQGAPRADLLAAAGSLLAMAVVLLWWRHRNSLATDERTHR